VVRGPQFEKRWHNPFLTLNPEQFQPISIKFCEFRSSGIWYFVTGWVVLGVLRRHRTFKREWLIRHHRTISHKNRMFSNTAVNNSNFWYKMVSGDLSIHQHKLWLQTLSKDSNLIHIDSRNRQMILTSLRRADRPLACPPAFLHCRQWNQTICPVNEEAEVCKHDRQ